MVMNLKTYIEENEGSAVMVMKYKLYDEALILTSGNVTAAAKKLGVSRSALSIYANNWKPKGKK